MPDQPYTPADLAAEAARQHAELAKNTDGRQVLVRMLDATVASTLIEDGDTGLTWDEALNCPQFEEPQQAIHDLIVGAADVSAWAVQLGADGLEPEDHTLTVDGDGRPLVRLHCAFHPDLGDISRVAFMNGLAQVLADGM
ncbi:hypothetical protein ABT185_07565 [Streptomyces clavifer]|uniref:hypothetical protein n=1 Tax=Streptomyces clavifer TaxID=68188 RepID=UPI00331CB92A